MWVLKTFDTRQFDVLRRYCKEHKFIIHIYPEEYQRNYEYRREFFIHNKPHFKGKYFCAYCGTLLDPDEVTVDHIISVKRAKKNRLAQWLLTKLKIENINDETNLAAACIDCNCQKGSKLGIWMIRGFLGKHKYFWISVYCIFFVWILILIYLVVGVIL